MTRLWADAHRFGMTPAKLVSRLTSRTGPKIVSNSLPKAGSHLLERALCQHPRIYRAPVRTLHRRSIEAGEDLATYLSRLQPNQLLLTHLEYTEERAALLRRDSVRSLFMVRDPRDIVVSQAHFIAGRPQHGNYAPFAKLPDLRDRMRLVIEGSDDYVSLRTRLQSYSGWLDTGHLVVRYEDLVGATGGGNVERQVIALEKIFDHLGLGLTSEQVAALAAHTFSSASPTFRRGMTGQWRRHFDDALHRLYERQVGDLAAQYGYPVDKATP